MPDHMHALRTAAAGIGAELNASTVEVDQIGPNRSFFRVNLYWPFIDSVYVRSLASFPFAFTGYGPFIPFVLPPLQDTFDSRVTGEPDENTPLLELDEIMVSFDQRMEDVPLSDSVWNVAGAGNGSTDPDPDFAGKMVPEHRGRLSLKVSLYEKRQIFFHGDRTVADTDYLTHRFDNELWSGELTSQSLTNRAFRRNPHVWPGIAQTVNPYKTFALAVYADGLYDADNALERLALVGVTVSIRFKYPLGPSDTGANIQNSPLPGLGAKVTPSLTVTTPSAGDEILAEGAGGVSSSMEVIDSYIRGGLSGGYTRYSGRHAGGDVIQDDAGYVVIAVPLFANCRNGEFNQANADAAPYMDDPGVNTGPICVSGSVPIEYPITIHHVVAAVNMQSVRVNGVVPVKPADATLRHRIGVGLGLGLASDDVAYSQVAYLDTTFDQANASGYRSQLIDRCAHPALTTPLANLWDLLAVPLVYIGVASAARGYTAQGYPFFAGRSILPTQGGGGANRNSIGTTVGATIIPPTNGMEQTIEVRWSMETQGGPALAWGNQPVDTVFAGFGGHYVYIIGKKHLI